MDIVTVPVESRDVSAVELVAEIAAAQRAIAQLQGAQLRAIARLDDVRGGEFVAEEIAPELRLSRPRAQGRVALADTMAHRLPYTMLLLDLGSVDLDAVAAVAELTAPLTAAQARVADERLAARIGGRDRGTIRRIARDTVRRVDPHGYAARAARRRRDRRVELVHEDDAMATLSAYLPAETATAAYARIDTIARTIADPDRSRDQLRADVFAELLLGVRTDRVPAQVVVHIPVGTALNVTDTGCELTGHGPIPADRAREIMGHPGSVWRALLTDPGTGAPTDLGRRRYRPSAALAETVRHRDRHCRMPGCHRPAPACDLDHVTAWADGGSTTASNLVTLCRRHHRLKHRPGWHFRLDPDTVELHVRTPADRTHTTRPEPRQPAPAETGRAF